MASTYDYRYGFGLVRDAGDVTRKKGKEKKSQYCELFARTIIYVVCPGRWLALTRSNPTTPGVQATSAATTTFVVRISDQYS